MKLCCGSFGNDAVCCYQVEDFLLSQLNSLQNSNVILKMKFLACMIYRKENSGGPDVGCRIPDFRQVVNDI